MLFQSVIGQKEIKQQLVQMIRQNRLGHALLFLGKEGSGALPLAMAFANYVSLPKNLVPKEKEPSLFADEPVADKIMADPVTPEEIDAWMQQQPAWSKLHDMVHPDIHYSYPVVPRKSGDKPISTDYINEWRRFITENPYGNVYDWLQFINAENKQGNITVHECVDIIRKMNL